MTIDIITLFPDMVNAALGESIVGRARENNIVEVNIHNLRDWGLGSRKNVDDKPFGGSPGMLLMVEPIYECLKQLDYSKGKVKECIILTSARGKKWNQQLATTYLEDYDRIAIICGHYEGFDQRIIDNLIDIEISIGDYVLSGGELAACVITDSIVRLLPGALGNPKSLSEESHNETNQLEYPQYTRPAEFVTTDGQSWKAPEVLLSGNHAEIKKWQEAAMNSTAKV